MPILHNVYQQGIVLCLKCLTWIYIEYEDKIDDPNLTKWNLIHDVFHIHISNWICFKVMLKEIIFYYLKIDVSFIPLKHIRNFFVRSIYFNFNISSTSLNLFWTNLVWNLCIVIKSSFMDFIIFVCVWVFARIHQY
jgi:hypothetical protein